MRSAWPSCLDRAYGLTILNRRRLGKIWRLDAVQGVFACKPALPPGDDAFLRAIEAHLAASGFTKFPRLLPTLEGLAEVSAAGRAYVVRPWLPGSHPHLDADHPRDLRLTMEVAAEFHRAGEGFRWPHVRPGRESSLRTLAEKTEQIRSFGREEADPFARLYRQGAPVALEEATAAASLLAAAGSGVAPGATRGNGICHGDLAANNVLINGQTAYLLDLERAELDIPPVDLARLSRRVLAAQGWTPALFESLLAAYHRIRPLSAAEVRTTIALLHWPQAFWRLGHQYFVEALGRPREFFTRRLAEWRAQTGRRRAFLGYCRQYMW